MSKRTTYEILGYETKEDFANRNFTVLDEGITRKREAVKIAKDLYNNEPHRVIKLQSDDREFIQIFDNHKDYKENDY
jgi:hypothetical protein